MYTKTWNKHRTPQWEQQSTMNQQQQNRCLRTDSSLSHWGGGGLYALYWYQIFTLDSVVVKTQKLVKLTWRLPYYCNVSSLRNNLSKLTHYDETKKRAHDSQIVIAKVIAKENLKLSHSGPNQRQAKLFARFSERTT